VGAEERERMEYNTFDRPAAEFGIILLLLLLLRGVYIRPQLRMRQYAAMFIQ